jgi:NAD(P)-dependent dehydrogenase (short-subunit alcohol dehydrogenase family)
MTSHRIALICGAATGSVGEAVCERVCHTRAADSLLYLDRTVNPNLMTAGIPFAECDFSAASILDPESVSLRICDAILALAPTGRDAIVTHLYFCSGIYAHARLADWDPTITANIINVNLLGLLLALHAIQCVHAFQGASQATAGLTVCFMGSEHAVSASAGRAAYCAAKTGAVAALLSLRNSRCIGSAVWVAVGPIDTPMLHRNQWVTKAGGSEQYYEFVSSRPASEYAAVFRECDLETACRLAAEGCFDVATTIEAFGRYVTVRQDLFAQECGVHSASEVAGRLCEHRCQYDSGDLLRIRCIASDAVTVTPLSHWAFSH